MLNYIWGFMMVVGIAFAAINGRMDEVTNAVLDSAREAVTLCVTMLGVMALWVGIMEIATQARMIEGATKKIRPFIRFLFPDIPENHEAQGYITTNIIANILGLGWAATPAGLMAMKALARLEKSRTGRTAGSATKEMCTFLVINVSSLQLIPVNVIAYRSQYGSVNPMAVIIPGMIATVASTIFGIAFCKVMCHNKKW